MHRVSPTKKSAERSLEQFIHLKVSSNFSAASALSLQNVCIELYDSYSLDEATPQASFHNLAAWVAVLIVVFGVIAFVERGTDATRTRGDDAAER